MKMDVHFDNQGYQRVSVDRVTDLNAPTHKGIDGVYYNPDGQPPYIIAESKYGSSKLAKLVDGTPQMSEPWIMDRLEGAVDIDTYLDILDKGYESNLFHVETTGKISINKIDEAGKIIK